MAINDDLSSQAAGPGGTVGIYGWFMTDRYNENDASHRAIRLGIERGNGIFNMAPRKEAGRATKAVGFELMHDAERPGARPRYAPLSENLSYASGAWDLMSALRLARAGRMAVETPLSVMETVKMEPAGTAETAKGLSAGADALVAGGKDGLFTPMYLMVARKPAW